MSITTNFAAGQDVLGFTNVPATMGNIAGVYNAATGVMTLTSAGSTATLAQWQTALQSVTYSNSSDNPSVAARTVSYTVNDGTANSNIVTSTINVTAVNDAPVLATGSTLAYTENQAATAINTLITVTDRGQRHAGLGHGEHHGQLRRGAGRAGLYQRPGHHGQHRRGLQRGHWCDDADLGWGHCNDSAMAGCTASGDLQRTRAITPAWPRAR